MLMLMHTAFHSKTNDEWITKTNKNTNLSSFASQNNELLNEYISFFWFGCILAFKLYTTNEIDFVKNLFFSCAQCPTSNNVRISSFDFESYVHYEFQNYENVIIHSLFFFFFFFFFIFPPLWNWNERKKPAPQHSSF